MLNELKLILWKVWIIRKRHYILTFFEACIPIALFILIAIAAAHTGSRASRGYDFEPQERNAGDECSFFESAMFTIFTMFSFIFIYPIVLKGILEEKNSGIRELIKMVGMKSWMIWLGWFLHSLVANVIAIGIIITLMKVPIFGEVTAFFHSPTLIVFIFLVLYCIATVSYCFLISALFDGAVIAMSFAIVVQMLSFFILGPLLWAYCRHMSWFEKILLALFPNMNLHFGITAIVYHEMQRYGSHWLHFTETEHQMPNDITIFQVFAMFMIEIVLFTSLTYYVEGVRPGSYGRKRPLYFPFIKLIQLYDKTFGLKIDHDNSELTLIENIEHIEGVSIGIEISNLKKTYGNTMAVNGLNMDVYKNQITVLLGQNGAGKTTTMSMITGMTSLTAGSIKVDGVEMKDNLDDLRKFMGLCPQNNLFFPDFTVMEHLIFFSMLKGNGYQSAKAESVKLLKLLKILNKANEVPDNLSGGMQRKLSLAMSLLGDPKTLILDEPTTGMDAESRRDVWNMLLQWRKTKTILITTHFLEEADVLGDWIAIMANGRLQCYGTPLYLKNKYSTGYHLSLILNNQATNETISKIENVLKTYVSTAALVRQNGQNAVFTLPIDEKKNYPQVLGALDANSQILGIENISLNLTTLEDVFLKAKSELLNDGKSEELQANDQTQSIVEELYKLNDSMQSPSFLLLFRVLAYKQLTYLKRKFVYYIPSMVVSTILLLFAFHITQFGGGIFQIVFTVLVSHSVLFFIGNFIIFANEENSKSFTQLQFICGLNPVIYWFATFIIDFVVYTIALLIQLMFAYGTTLIYEKPFFPFQEILILYLILSLYGIPMLPYLYLFSYANTLAKSFASYLVFTIFFSTTPTLLYFFFVEFEENTNLFVLEHFFPILPHFSLTFILFKFYGLVDINDNWSKGYKCDKLFHFDSFTFMHKQNYCCVNPEGDDCRQYLSYFFNKEDGILVNLVEMVCGVGVLYFFVVFINTQTYKRMVHHLSAFIYKYPAPVQYAVQSNGSLNAWKLQKFYGKVLAVQDVTFSTHFGECYGLLGVNGAGKTTTFKMLVNELMPNQGIIDIVDQQNNYQRIPVGVREYFQRISYCPQQDALNPMSTAKELLFTFAAFRGFPWEMSEQVANYFIELFDLVPYADVPCGIYSGGNKRKLSLAVAFIGFPQNILMDEPTNGVDPASRRGFWNTLAQIKRLADICFLLSSHSMEECEVLCNRIAIMKDGKIRIEDSLPKLREQFQKGFNIIFKLKMFNDTSNNGFNETLFHVIVNNDNAEKSKDNVKDFMGDVERVFTSIELKDQHMGMLYYYVKDANKRWADMFRIVEALKTKHCDIIEDYTISETSLEDIFLSVARSH